MRPPRWVWLFLLLAFLHHESSHRRLRAARADGRRHAPNVLIIIGDDHAGGTLGIDGDPRHATPNLDRLAQQGVRFDRAFCNAPVCTPSRQSFITGRLPHAVGVTRLPTPLPDEAVTLGDWMGDLGYTTAAIGKMHFNSRAKHGFELRIDTPDWQRHLKSHPPTGGDHRRPWRPFQEPASVWLNSASRDFGLPEDSMEGTFFADRAAEFFQSHKTDPFLLVVGFNEPHSPFRFPREYAGRFRPEMFCVPPLSPLDRLEQPQIFASLSPEEIRGVQSAYYTSLSFLDHQVGRILDALDSSGLADDTIVVYVGDNGYMLGYHGRFEKHVLYDPAVRVPLIVRWPKQLPSGRRVTDQVELVDVFPTLMELCHLPSPPDLHGRTLAPLLRGDPGAHGRDVVFSEYLENEEAMARSPRYKLIMGTSHRPRRDGYAAVSPPTQPYARLYDLESDPGETTDVSTRPDLAPVLSDLRRRLHARLTSTRPETEAVSPGLSEVDAIHWCLRPRDTKGE